MDVTATTAAPVETACDTVALGVFDGKRVAHDLPDGTLQALLDAGEARTAFKHLAVAHGAGKRWIVVGLGDRDAFTPERARIAATAVHGRAVELGTRALCWELPHRLDDHQAGGFVEGTVLASYRYAGKPSDEDRRIAELVVSDHADRSGAVRVAEVVARAQNRARDWQDRPSNELTPAALGEHALALDGLDVEVEGPADLLARGMGAFAAVAQGGGAEPRLITARYEHPDATGPLLGLVGKAVTHDTGGYSIKPAAGMERMKYDMSGGAAVLQAMAAIAELELPIRAVAVVGATENVVSATAMKPGDVVRAMDGTSIEITNTDAEGRLVLADCLLRAKQLGAEVLVDVATLTGGIVTALGSVYAGGFCNDEALWTAVQAAGERSGERVWRMPLDPEYAKRVEGRFATLTNSPEDKGKGHPINGAEFLHHFAGETPWAHLDICGVAWDTGRPWAAKGGSGFGVRLLVEFARASSSAG